MGRRRRGILGPDEQAPDFQLPDTKGRVWTSSGILSRAPALLAFFKTTCPVCKFTFPFIERIYRSIGQDQLQVFGVSQDREQATNSYVGELSLTFPILIDSEDAGYQVSNAFGIQTVPTVFLVEPSNRIALAFEGWSKTHLSEIGHRVMVNPFRADEMVPEWKSG